MMALHVADQITRNFELLSSTRFLVYCYIVFQASRSNNVYLRFVPNPVNLDNSETTVLKLVMNTKQNRPSEEEIVVSALPNWSSKMIKLFSKKVQVIPALKSVVSSGKVLMSTGAIVSETFTVINFGRRQHFTFKVSKRLNISITVLSLPDIYYSSPVQTVIIV